MKSAEVAIAYPLAVWREEGRVVGNVVGGGGMFGRG